MTALIFVFALVMTPGYAGESEHYEKFIVAEEFPFVDLDDEIGSPTNPSESEGVDEDRNEYDVEADLGKDMLDSSE